MSEPDWMNDDSQWGEQQYLARLREIATLLEGALLGHPSDQPFSFTRGESADIEVALRLARRG